MQHAEIAEGQDERREDGVKGKKYGITTKYGDACMFIVLVHQSLAPASVRMLYAVRFLTLYLQVRSHPPHYLSPTK